MRRPVSRDPVPLIWVSDSAPSVASANDQEGVIPMTNQLRAPGIALLGALTLAVGIAAVARSSSDPPAQAAPKATAAKAMRLEDTTVIVETNATDGDAGLQFFLDGEPWRSMKIFRPGGKKI